MIVLMLAINDPAGTGIQFCKAVNRSGRHTCRLVTLETRYTHAWEKDLHVPDLIGPEATQPDWPSWSACCARRMCSIST